MPEYFDFQVSLREIEPRIWRRFLIRSDATFEVLHEAIQDACGWHCCHLFEFQDEAGELLAGAPDDSGFAEQPVPDAAEVSLASFFSGRTRKKSCLYVYDFGDDWQHDVAHVAQLAVYEFALDLEADDEEEDRH